MKALLVDKETLPIVSTVMTQTEILNKEVFLVIGGSYDQQHRLYSDEFLEATSVWIRTTVIAKTCVHFDQVEPLEEAIASPNDDEVEGSTTTSMRHMKACVFLRPTNQNFLALSKVLRQPVYSEYHLCSTSGLKGRFELSPQSSPMWCLMVVCHSLQLAMNMSALPLLQKREFSQPHSYLSTATSRYADVIALNSGLFSLGSQSVAQLHREQSMWTAFEESVFQRQVDGLFAASISLGSVKRGKSVVPLFTVKELSGPGPVTAANSSGLTLPVIRYSSASPLSRKVALALQKRLEQDESLFESVAGSAATPVNSGGGMLILVADRRDDPVTPLLTQWTYQAMVIILGQSD